MPALLGGIAMASVAALSMPAFAILYGLVFGQYTSYGEGSISSSQLMSNMARFCVILTALATLNWIANSFYYLFFLMFGELQARSARNRIFDALIKKDMAWFDTREDGIAAFLPTVQISILGSILSGKAVVTTSTRAFRELEVGTEIYYDCSNKY
ncbi:hypothetical protein J4E86_008577 [Alternaria arbusti]|uniref:uncharacterized protein n=1 Tax=Alternaria arbusti TaxID=232088 RepID=UPI00221EE400|nr:uncharacterized protein J4E86_008577 [Alternaria arbusti]KAI4946954.1 hypothetical protein J4E86_008577 [Alternaria arbusti]